MSHPPYISSDLSPPSLTSMRIYPGRIVEWNTGRYALDVTRADWRRSPNFTREATSPFNYQCEGMMLSTHLHAALRCPWLVRASMFDNGTLWLISGDEYRDSPGVKNKQGGFFKGKWFHFNTPLKRRAGKGQSALYLLVRAGFPSKSRKTGGRWYGRDRLVATSLNSVFRKATESLFYAGGTRSGAMGAGSLKVLAVCCGCRMFAGKFSYWFLNSKHAAHWKVDVRRKKRAFGFCFWVTSSFYFFSSCFFTLKCHGTLPCVSWTYSSGQVWLSPFFFLSFIIPLQFQRKPSLVFEHVKTSGCTWANRVSLWTYFSKQSPVQCCPTAAYQRFVHQPPRSLQ